MSDVNVGVRIALKGDLQAQISRVNGQFDHMREMTTVMSLATLAQSLSQLSQQAKGLTTALKQPFVDFEREMVGVKARMLGTSKQQYDQLKQQAKELGASTIFTSTQIAQGMNKLAMAGFDADAIKASIADVAAFVQANGINFGIGADIATDIGTAFGYEASELGEVLDVLTLGANSANTDISMLGETMKYAAADAHSLGLSLQETTAMAGILANSGIKGSMAGTTLKETVKALAVPDDAAKKVLDRLKIRVYDDAGQMRNITGLLRDVNDATKGLTQKQRAEDIQAIFKERGARGILTIMSQGQGGFEKFLDALQHSAAGTVKRMQNTMAESLAAGLGGINSRKEALFTTITEAGREQLVGVQQLKIGFLSGLHDIAQENSILSSRVSLATQLLSDIGGVLASSGAVLTTVLSGFTALAMYKNQRAVQGIAQSMTTGQGVLGGYVQDKNGPWHNKEGRYVQSPVAGNLPTNIENGVELGVTRAGKQGFWRSRAGYGLRGVGAGLAFSGISMGLEALAIRNSNLAAEEQEKALKNTFNRNSWGMFGSAAGAVIGSVVAPGIGTAIGGVLGQFVGDWAGGKNEHANSLEGQYEKFLAEQKEKYTLRNAADLTPKELLLYKGFNKADFWDPMTGKHEIPKSVRPEFDSSLTDVQKLIKKLPILDTAAIKRELQEFIGENISTPEMLSKELMELSDKIYANPYLSKDFQSQVLKMDNNGETAYEIRGTFLDMVRSQLPQEFLDSEIYQGWAKTSTQNTSTLITQGKDVDTRKYLPELMTDYNKWKFEQLKGKETKSEETLEVNRNIYAAIIEVRNSSKETLEELRNRPLALKVGR